MEKSENKKNRFDGDGWALESSHEWVADAMVELEKRLKIAGWSEDEIGLFPTAAEEAFTNAVIHGNLGIKRREEENLADYERRVRDAESMPKFAEKKVRVQLNLSENEATITVEDEGDGFGVDSIPDPKTGERIYEPSGRGIEIMRAACDEVKFSPGKVILSKKRSSKKS